MVKVDEMQNFRSNVHNKSLLTLGSITSVSNKILKIDKNL